MGKTLHRYLLRELAAAFLVGMGVFTFILLVSRILELVDLIVARGVPGHRVLALFAYILPSFMELTIPMALLLAVVVAFGRLATDGEMVAMRSAGISLYQMLSPSMSFAVMVALSTFVLAAWGRPWANHQIKETLYDMARDRATAALRPRVFNSDFNGLVVYVDRIDRENGLMKGIMVADERDSYRRTTMIASSGRMVSNEQTRSIYLMLLDGTSLSFHAGQESYDKTDFESLEVNLDIETQIAAARSRAPEPRELTWQRLLEARASRLAVGDPATEESIEINRKLVLPVASIVLALLGVPLGMQRSRTVRARSFAVSLAVILLYYFLFSAATTIARKGSLPPAVVMWIPNLLFAIGGAVLLSHSARDKLHYPSLLRWPSRAGAKKGSGS